MTKLLSVFSLTNNFVLPEMIRSLDISIGFLECGINRRNKLENFSQSHAPVPAPPLPPEPPERPPASELNGAIFEVRAFVMPAEAPEKNDVALFIMGPMLPVAAWIFWDTKWLRNSDVAECLLSIPKAAFFALLDSSRTVIAFVFASMKESTFYKDICLLKELIITICQLYLYIMHEDFLSNNVIVKNKCLSLEEILLYLKRLNYIYHY